MFFYDTTTLHLTIRRRHRPSISLVVLVGLSLLLATAVSAQEKVYWIDQSKRDVQRANLDGTGRELLLFGLDSPTDVEIDEEAGKVYWLDDGEEGTNKIQRSDLDGSHVEDVISLSHVHAIHGFALDREASKVYWTSRATAPSADTKIQRASLDGSNVEDLVSEGLSSPQDVAVDASRGKIYWTDAGLNTIRRANLDGTDVEVVIDSGLMSPLGIEVDSGAGKLYWTDGFFDTISRADLDGTGREEVVAAGGSLSEVTLDPAAGKLYWTDGRTLNRSGLDGDLQEEIHDQAGVIAKGLALAPGSDLLYWTDVEGRSLHRFDLTTDEDSAILRTVLGPGGPPALAIDPDGKRIYFSTPFEIKRSNLDGSQVENLVGPDLSAVTDLELDLAAGKMYWIAGDLIQRANLVGTEHQILLTETPSRGIALDPVHGHIYWIHQDQDEIQRSGLDGTTVETVVGGVGQDRDIEVDVALGKIYWSDGGALHRADLDGTEPEFLVNPRILGLEVDGSSGEVWAATSPGGAPIVRIHPGDWSVEPAVTGPISPRRLGFGPACPFPEDLILTELLEAGAASFTACRSITAGPDVLFTGSSSVVLAAGSRVVLGDGFRVEKGGSLQVVIDPTLDPSIGPGTTDF